VILAGAPANTALWELFPAKEWSGLIATCGITIWSVVGVPLSAGEQTIVTQYAIEMFCTLRRSGETENVL
jgi:hypothetical protein